jgi:GH35 family endo-1,4-beta-xylanase
MNKMMKYLQNNQKRTILIGLGVQVFALIGYKIYINNQSTKKLMKNYMIDEEEEKKNQILENLIEKFKNNGTF